jgi:pimeloyl-ACP methyl ester carboxylesterase
MTYRYRRAVHFLSAVLVELDDVGHIPHVESPDRFHQALVGFLKDQQ